MIRVLLFVLLLSAAHAAALDRDLGLGLSYHRAHALPGELPAPELLNKGASILDLRYATGDGAAATTLNAWLKFHASSHVPVFVLVNADTSSALLTALSSRGHTAGLVVLSSPTTLGFTPDIAVTTDAKTERTAYDALEKGAAADALVNPPNDKPRNDEAKLAHDRLPENGPEPTAPDANAPVVEVRPVLPPPLIDAVLQRAVHLHRALLALKKL